jgi:hypothetical protein
MRQREQQGEGGEMTEREDTPTAADNDPALDETMPPNARPAGEEPRGVVVTHDYPVEDEPVVPGPSRVGCRTELRGWAGAHLHGAVRPRRRAAGRGRPPGRWC